MGVDDAQLRRLLDRVRREVDDGLIPSCQVSLGSSAHWVLAEIIEEVAGSDFRNEIHARVTEPLGLGRLLGLGPAEQDNIADLVLVGEHATADELEAAFGVRELPRTEVTDDVIAVFNEPEMRELGMLGGGAFPTARDIAVIYQALMHNTGGLWDAELLEDVTSRIRDNLPDPLGVPAARTLGLITAGDDNMSHLRGMGRTVSSRTFGHNGAGGQLAWADPVTGLSLGMSPTVTTATRSVAPGVTPPSQASSQIARLPGDSGRFGQVNSRRGV